MPQNISHIKSDSFNEKNEFTTKIKITNDINGKFLILEKYIGEHDIYDCNENKENLEIFGNHKGISALVQGKKYSKETANLNYETENSFVPDIIEILEMKNNKIVSSSHMVEINRHSDLICNVKSSHDYDICTYCLTIENYKYIPLISLQYSHCYIKFFGKNLFEENISCTCEYIYAGTKERKYIAMSGIDFGNYNILCGLIGYKSGTNIKIKQNRQFGIKTKELQVEFDLYQYASIYDIKLCVLDNDGNTYYDYIQLFGIKSYNIILNQNEISYEQQNENLDQIFKDHHHNENNPICVSDDKIFIKLNKLLEENMYILMKCKSTRQIPKIEYISYNMYNPNTFLCLK
ncbi:MAG: hypothetical protein Terrestrivirus2_125 [Terrestrivirus sp.]|uniref:Uncharacterized protein n=1 Tax=Terrestrivirus sp. TaxID=2487775 RepID=A0A3G4ZLA6_9VIRU|nr:MAG: hypothetical protein Terrestrivirus2_125 [Terrestrivirus sp.]